MRFALIALGCLAGTLTLPASEPSSGAQDPATTFQFVSVRRSPPGSCPPTNVCIGASSTQPSSAATMSALSGGRFEARQQTVENLARVAYGFEHVDPRRGVVARGRNFTTGEYRFDITAVAEEEWSRPTDGEVVPPELRAMLRTLLEERFQLEVRIQTKKVGVYALRLTDRRGELGPGLLPSANECLGPYTEAPRRVAEAVPRCAFRFEPSRIEAGALTMADVARLVSRIDGIQVDRPIVDDTGLTSTYDLSLSLAVIEIGKSTRFIVSEPTTTGEPGGPRAMLADRRPITVRDALKNQLGLKLEAAKLPIKTLLIERAKHPKED